MAEYKIYFRESVEKDLKGIPKNDIKKILRLIELLSLTPRPPSSEKLTGQDRYRLRQGRYRILYSIHDVEHTVWIEVISNAFFGAK